MKKVEKILSFIVCDDKLLMLHGNDTDPQFHESFWYVVTGSVEPVDNCLEDAVRREIWEETNLKTIKTINLDWKFEYESLGDNCIEHAFISYVLDGKIILNEENYEYKWCTFDEFIEEVKWFYDKKELKEKLNQFFNKV